MVASCPVVRPSIERPPATLGAGGFTPVSRRLHVRGLAETGSPRGRVSEHAWPVARGPGSGTGVVPVGHLERLVESSQSFAQLVGGRRARGYDVQPVEVDERPHPALLA